MKIWVLLAIAGLLLVWSLSRERFEATASIKKPPYDDAEATRIFDMLSKTDQDAVIKTRRENSPGVTDAKLLRREAEKHVANTVKSFYERVYAPATVPITSAQIDEMYSRPGPGGPDETNAIKNILKKYFVSQSGVGNSVTSGYAAALAGLGQNAGYLRPNAPVQETAGTSPQGTSTTGMNAAPLSGAAGLSSLTGAATTTAGASDLTGMGTGAIPGGSAGTGTGSSTGGSSTSSMGPTSGNSGTRSKQVFGPVFTAQGPSAGGPTADSSRTNRYPELMGGMTDTSTRIEGVGVVEPSKNWKLTMDGSLPPACSTGSDSGSSLFPTSRCPGDMDLIPDPYRLSRNFSTASYSSKTEPAPFLTDFSAFLK